MLVVGLPLLGICAAAMVHRVVFSNLALREFDQARSDLRRGNASVAVVSLSVEPRGGEEVDFSLWSAKRIRAYRESLLVKKDPPLAVLRIDRLRIGVPVFEGTDDLVLNRGVGWIAGTARPGEPGNIGIAGHRDGFFRGFKNIVVGDAVELATPEATSLYMVDSVEIVYPDNVGVLQPRGVPSLTLVTCYPFYFVGDAPKRFIVHGTLKQKVGSGKSQEDGSASARTAQFDSKENKK